MIKVFLSSSILIDKQDEKGKYSTSAAVSKRGISLMKNSKRRQASSCDRSQGKKIWKKARFRLKRFMSMLNLVLEQEVKTEGSKLLAKQNSSY